MSWIVSNWRLKLLALVMTLGLLAAVAFSQNPIASKTVTTPIAFVTPPDDLILINPPVNIGVTVFGLSEALKAADPTTVTATADASRLKHAAGSAPAQATIDVVPKVVANGVNLRDTRIPVSVKVDERKTVSLDIEFKNTKPPAPGFQLVNEKLSVDPAKVTLTGPASSIEGLKARVVYPDQVNNSFQVQLPVEFVDVGNKPVNWPPFTLPKSKYDPHDATANVVAVRVSGSRTVALRVPPPRGQPACGYAVTAIEITPTPFPTISGPPDLINIASLDLPQIDISGATSDVVRSFNVSVPNGVTSDPARVMVKIGVQKALSCAPTPPTSSPP